MEIIDNQYTQDAGSDGLQVTRNMKANWLTTSKWAMFMAILGFIYVGLAIIAVAFMMPLMRMALAMSGQSELASLVESAGTLFVIVVLLVLAAMFFVHLFHFRFSTGIQRAMQYDNQDAFESAWRNFRNYFRLNGIITITVMVLYVIILIVVIGTAAGSDGY